MRALLLLLAAGCSADPSPQPSAGGPVPPGSSAAQPPAAAIGVASMEADGTLVLDLRRPALALVRYPPSHPEYAKVRAHVGPIAPGESRPVPPWPEAFEEAKVDAAVRAWAGARSDWGGEPSHEIQGTRDGDVIVVVWGKAKRRQVVVDPKTYAIKGSTDL